MALEFGSKKIKTRNVKKELFPNDAVLTMLPLDSEKEGRGAKKFQFNNKAIELLGINQVDKVNGTRSNEEISFTREPITNEDQTQILGYTYFIFVNNGNILIKDENGEEKEAKILANKVTIGDSSISNAPRYDQLVETYNLDTTQPNYFKIVKVDRQDINVSIYQLNQTLLISENTISESKVTAKQVVEEANKEMEEMHISIN